jgi:hypothetical protein
MTLNRMQVGIDFSQKTVDFCLMFPDGRPLEPHRAFDNSRSGYSLAKQLLLDALENYEFDGLDVSGEATGFLWLPFFLQLAADPELQAHDLDLFLLNPRWVHWFKKCFSQDKSAMKRIPSTSLNAPAPGGPRAPGRHNWQRCLCASTPVSAFTW